MGIRRGQGRNPEILDDPKRGGGRGRKWRKGGRGEGIQTKTQALWMTLEGRERGGGVKREQGRVNTYRNLRR